MGGFVQPCYGTVADAAQSMGGFFCVMPGDVIPCIGNGNAFVRMRVGNRGFEEREPGSFVNLDFMNVAVLAIPSVKAEIHFSVQCHKQFRPCLMVVQRGEVQRITIREDIA